MQLIENFYIFLCNWSWPQQPVNSLTTEQQKSMCLKTISIKTLYHLQSWNSRELVKKHRQATNKSDGYTIMYNAIHGSFVDTTEKSAITRLDCVLITLSHVTINVQLCHAQSCGATPRQVVLIYIFYKIDQYLILQITRCSNSSHSYETNVQQIFLYFT